MIPITKMISDYNHSSPNDIKYIVLHDTGNWTDTPEGNGNYFSGGNRNSSAHYFVGDRSIVQSVDDFNGAWHCGDGLNRAGINNHNSLGIEMCNTNGQITEATVLNVIALVQFKMVEYNVPIINIVRHYDASGKICPQPWCENNWAKWYDFKRRLIGAPAPSKPVIDQTPVFAPLNYSYPNNAQLLGTTLYLRDSNGIIIPGRYIGDGDKITVLDVSGSKQLVFAEYPTQYGVRSGYVTNYVSRIQYTYYHQWSNGSTPEIVYDENGSRIGSLDPWEKATPLYRKNGKLHVVYSVPAGTKSGYVAYNGGFTKF